MRRSTERILTTHTGSLPRPQRVVELLLEEQKHPRSKTAELAQAVQAAVAEVVQKQIAAGIDIINDGEQGRTDYTTHVKDRLSGFDGPSSPPLGTGEPEFPELSAMLAYFASPFQNRPACSGPVGWTDFAALETDIAQAKRAMAGSKAIEWFMTSPSPGQIARYLKNKYYPTDEAYLFALADVMAREYRAIVDAGLVLQIDCPDLALSRHMVFAHLSLEEFRKVISMHVEALNHAVKDIAPERMRMHICWASTQGPHHKDVPLRDIVDIVLRGRPQAVSFPGANPRHGHEWKVWKDVKLPDGKIIIPGVIDSTSNFVEHPELVADRIMQYANVVGRESMIAGVDCGFGTFAGRLQVDSKIVWMKLASLAEGAELASRQLW
ncbi:MAG: cobalamin-independent methionine synthase II family protein [Hyphomicrobiales bacterium]|nr:cobalamin-independent methionine synthase II family protein [Hyphomicrobiales bacterium]